MKMGQINEKMNASYTWAVAISRYDIARAVIVFGLPENKMRHTIERAQTFIDQHKRLGTDQLDTDELLKISSYDTKKYLAHISKNEPDTMDRLVQLFSGQQG